MVEDEHFVKGQTVESAFDKLHNELYNFKYNWRPDVVEDVVRALGFLCMGSRLRRIGERLQADTQQIIGEAGLGIQAGQYPFLAAIDRAGPLTIGELAQAVGISQPGTTRTIIQLLELGFVDMQPAPGDQRRRLVSLTSTGRELVDYSKAEVWPNIAAAVTELCGDLDGPILDQLAAIEDRLAEAPLSRRTPHTEHAK